MRKRKKSLVFGMILLLLFLGIGYAYLSTTLSINGTTDIDSNTWDVYFDNVNVTSGSVSGEQEIEAPTITSDTTVEFHVRLKEPGEFYEFTIDAKNDGTIDAMIETITKKVNGGTTIPAYLNYTVTYSDDLEIEDNHLLAHESLETYKVRVEYKTDIDPSDLPSTAQNLTLSFGVSYVQSDSSVQSVGHKITVYTVSGTEMQIGEAVPDDVTLYSTAAEAIAAIPNNVVCLEHIIQNGIIIDSYVVFEITSEMASANSKIKAGIYSLQGRGSSMDVNNFDVLSNAFDSSLCYQGSAGKWCDASVIYAGSSFEGRVGAEHGSTSCYIESSGNSCCYSTD